MPTLVMFAHPRCPCTRASLQELETLAAQAPGQLDIRVYFYLPAGEPQSWAETELWEIAQRLPNVHVNVDPDNARARRFRVATSGHVILYRGDGKLLFSGGITAARGHVGDSLGKTAVLSHLNGDRTDCFSAPVFGCSLRSAVQPSGDAVRDDGVIR